jgi:hypothetical protein
MGCRWNSVGLSLLSLLAIAPATAWCESKPAPLQLKLGVSSVTASTMPLAAPRAAELRSAVDLPTGRRGHVFHEAKPSLSQRALQSLLANADEEESAVGSQAGDTFRFERRGNAGRNISQGYKRMCANVSEKIWNDPNGKRVKFDIAGKPGVAVEIPLR